MKKNPSIIRKSTLFVALGFLVVAVFLLTNSVKVLAASSVSMGLPYVVPVETGLNSVFDLEKLVDVYEGYFVPNVQPYFPTTDFTKSIWYVSNLPNDSNEGFIQIIIMPNPTCDSTISNDIQYNNWDLQTNGIYFTPNGRMFTMNVKLDCQLSNMYQGSNQFDGMQQLFGNYVTQNTSRGTITFQYPFMLYGLDEVYDSSGNYLIMTNNVPTTVPETEDPTAPDMSSLDLDNSLNTTNPPTSPTYSNTFNDPMPTWDSTAPFESLFSIILWGFNRIHSMWTSFREYLFSWLAYFIQMLTYVIQKIIDAIKYIITWLYNQFLNWLNPYLKIINFIAHLLFDEDDQIGILDLLSALKESLDTKLTNLFSGTFFSSFWSNFSDKLDDGLEYFANLHNFFASVVSLGKDPSTNEFNFTYLLYVLFVPKTSDVVAIFVNNDDFGIISFGSALVTKARYIYTSFSNISPAWIIHVPALNYHGKQIGDFDISFAWYSTYKDYVDGIVSAFLYIGYVRKSCDL